MPDVEARAERLREYLESECTKFNADALAEAEVDLDVDPPAVPHRFVTNEWDGSTTWLRFGDSPDEMREICDELGGGDSPWLAATVLDLDTGNTYQVDYTASLTPLRWAWGYRYRLKWEDDSYSEWMDVRQEVPTKDDAERALANAAHADHAPDTFDSPYITEAWKEESDAQARS